MRSRRSRAHPAEGDVVLPAFWRNESAFTILRLQSAGLQSAHYARVWYPALLVSISIRAAELELYRLWIDEQTDADPFIPAFRANVIDLDAHRLLGRRRVRIRHYHVPRETINMWPKTPVIFP